MLTIIGGTYIENCREPISHEIFGSGLRAAVALSGKDFDINFYSCIDETNRETIQSLCSTFNIVLHRSEIETIIGFGYDYPLAKPSISSVIIDENKVKIGPVTSDNILYYGMLEADAEVHGNNVVYDPQNWKSFNSTGSSANHLAIILNQHEAQFFSKIPFGDLRAMGKQLLEQEKADVIVIKNGPSGAVVIEKDTIEEIPVFKSSSVWPIGSGDIFSAVFAWKWIMGGFCAKESAYFASLYTAYYCDSRDIPLPKTPVTYQPILGAKAKKVYLAGPFFTIGERWLIHHSRKALQAFGHVVFSPFHDAVVGNSQNIVDEDIKGLVNADVLFAIVSGVDPGTIFEIGYAKALGKRVIVLAENVLKEDLFMLQGTNCEITDDFSTAIYKVSW